MPMEEFGAGVQTSPEVAAGCAMTGDAGDLPRIPVDFSRVLPAS
jgi:hypothetical protein